MLVKWGIRLPNQFLSYNTLLQSENQAKVAYFTKPMILIFWCPEETRITNFTRMPQQLGSFQILSIQQSHWSISLKYQSQFFFRNQFNEKVSISSDMLVREAPLNLASPLFGHCPNSNCPPPPALKRALWGTFFRADLSHFVKSPFWGYVSATKNPGKPSIPC